MCSMRNRFAGQYGLELSDAALLDATARGTIRTPERAIELIARIGSGDCPPEAHELARDALLQLCQVPGWTIPPGGIRYRCEACEEPTVMWRQQRRAAHPVLWEAADRAALARKFTSETLPIENRHRTSISEGHVIRWFLVCQGCARQTLRRCRHEDSFGPCDELVMSRQYCARHAASAERAKRSGTLEAAA